MRQQTLGLEPAVEWVPGQQLIFDRFPLPPSSNAIYKHFYDKRKRKIVRASADPLLAYKEEVRLWALCNKRLCIRANELLRDEKSIRVKAWVTLEKSRIWTKDGRPKKNDVSNRGKALFDGLADVIGIDDKLFKSVGLEMAETNDYRFESCLVAFEPCDVRSIDAIRADLFSGPESRSDPAI